MKEDNYGMQDMQAEAPQKPEAAVPPLNTEKLPKEKKIRRKPNAAAEVINGTVIEAEIETRMRKKMLRKYLIRVGACVLIFSAVFLRIFGSSLLSLLRGSDDMFIRHFREPVSLEANPKLVELMYDAARDGGRDFSFDTELLRCNTAEQAFKIISASCTAMLDEHPEIFYLYGADPTIYTGGKDGEQLGKRIDCSFFIFEEFQHMPRKKMYSEMEKEAKRIVSLAPKHCSDSEKALFIHDFLAGNVEYDVAGSKSDDYDLCFTAYGALKDHSAVCNGYACAYAYLMHLMDIDCKVVTGEAKTEGLETLLVKLSLIDNRHAWNYIELDGEHYWVDVTWDDFDPVSHTYCFIDDKTLFESHKLNDAYKDLPSCKSTKLNDSLLLADQNGAAN